MMMLIDYALLTGSSYLIYKAVEKLDLAELISSKFKKNDEYCLTLGYRRICGVKVPITVNMRSCPHLLVCGLSSQGKSKCVEYAMKDRDCILLNAFEEDFKSLKCRRIIGNEKILKYLTGLLENPYKRERPFFIVIDELLVLSAQKDISRAIMNLLSVARHFNLYLVGVSQRGTKQDLSYKDLFNSRACFRMVDSSSYGAVLGCNIDETLVKREFLLYSDSVYKGRTFDV